LIIAEKIRHEKSLQLKNTFGQLVNAPSLNFVDLSYVRTALQGQMKLVETLQRYDEQVRNLLVQGNELIRQPSVPKYVQQDIQCVEKLYNDKCQSARDQLDKLQVRKRNNEDRVISVFVFSCSSNFGNGSMRTNVVFINRPND
jgi:hypothetical protein